MSYEYSLTSSHHNTRANRGSSNTQCLDILLHFSIELVSQQNLPSSFVSRYTLYLSTWLLLLLDFLSTSFGTQCSLQRHGKP